VDPDSESGSKGKEEKNYLFHNFINGRGTVGYCGILPTISFDLKKKLKLLLDPYWN
jgi:hypothetical protein